MRIIYSLLIKMNDKSAAKVSDLAVEANPFALVQNSDRTLLSTLANASGENTNLKIHPDTKKPSTIIGKLSEIKISSEKNSRTELCKSLNIRRERIPGQL